MKKIILIFIALLIMLGHVSAREKSLEVAGDKVQKEVQKLMPSVIAGINFLDDEKRHVINSNPQISEGRKIHFLDYDELLNNSSSNLEDYEATWDNNYYLYWVGDDAPRTLFVIEENADGKVSENEAGGDPKGYLEALEKVERFATDKEYKLFHIRSFVDSETPQGSVLFGYYAIQFEVDGSEYYLPFWEGSNPWSSESEFTVTEDYRCLPSTADFLQAAKETAREIENIRLLEEKTGEKIYGTPVMELHTRKQLR